MTDEQENGEEQNHVLPAGVVDESGKPITDQTSMALGITVHFHSPLKGKHNRQYRERLSAGSNGALVPPTEAARYVAALALVREITWHDGREEEAFDPYTTDYDETDYAFINFVTQKAEAYHAVVTLVPFDVGERRQLLQLKRARARLARRRQKS